MTDRQLTVEFSFGPERRQQAAIALATATLFGGAKLMGTTMAIVVGRRGTPFAVSMVLTAYFAGKMCSRRSGAPSRTSRDGADWYSSGRASPASRRSFP